MRAIARLRFYTFVLHGSIPYSANRLHNHTHVICLLGPPIFQQATLKNWVWPGDKARNVQLHNYKYKVSETEQLMHMYRGTILRRITMHGITLP